MAIGDVEFIAPISIKNGASAVVRAYDVFGCIQTVYNLTQRYNLPTYCRVDGMLCYQQDSDTWYQLVGGVDNANWQTPAFPTGLPIGAPGQSVYFGSGSSVGGASCAYGYNADAPGAYSVSIGANSYGYSDYNVIVGYGAQANGGYVYSSIYTTIVGANATSAGGAHTLLGYGATVTGGSQSGNLVCGRYGQADEGRGVALGDYARVRGSCISIGYQSRAMWTQGSIAMGDQAYCDAQWSMVFGYQGKDNNNAKCIVLGSFAQANAPNQMIVGSELAPITTVYIGKGPGSGAPLTTTFSFTPGSGTDIAGASGIFQAGPGSGAAVGSSLSLKTPTAGATGSTQQTLTTRVYMDATNINIGSADNENVNIVTSATGKLGFYGATAAVKQTVSGATGGNAALASLLTALATIGLITDSTT